MRKAGNRHNQFHITELYNLDDKERKYRYWISNDIEQGQGYKLLLCIQNMSIHQDVCGKRSQWHLNTAWTRTYMKEITYTIQLTTLITADSLLSYEQILNPVNFIIGNLLQHKWGNNYIQSPQYCNLLNLTCTSLCKDTQQHKKKRSRS